MTTLKKIHFLLIGISIALCNIGCLSEKVQPDPINGITGEFQTADLGWQGDLALSELEELPQERIYRGIGVITEEEDFAILWDAYASERALPQPNIDFTTRFVIFVYDTSYYNLCRIVGVKINQGILNPIISSSSTTMEIQERIYVAMIDLPRRGIVGVVSGNRILSISRD